MIYKNRKDFYAAMSFTKEDIREFEENLLKRTANAAGYNAMWQSGGGQSLSRIDPKTMKPVYVERPPITATGPCHARIAEVPASARYLVTFLLRNNILAADAEENAPLFETLFSEDGPFKSIFKKTAVLFEDGAFLAAGATDYKSIDIKIFTNFLICTRLVTEWDGASFFNKLCNLGMGRNAALAILPNFLLAKDSSRSSYNIMKVISSHGDLPYNILGYLSIRTPDMFSDSYAFSPRRFINGDPIVEVVLSADPIYMPAASYSPSLEGRTRNSYSPNPCNWIWDRAAPSKEGGPWKRIHMAPKWKLWVALSVRYLASERVSKATKEVAAFLENMLTSEEEPKELPAQLIELRGKVLDFYKRVDYGDGYGSAVVLKHL